MDIFINLINEWTNDKPRNGENENIRYLFV